MVSRRWLGGVILGGGLLSVLLFQNCSGMKGADFGLLGKSSVVGAAGVESVTHFNYSVASSSAAAAKPPAYRWQDSALDLQTYGAYSPSALTGEKFWFGGWMSSADPFDFLRALDRGAAPASIAGSDKIFYAERQATEAETRAGARLVLSMLGYLVNDPVVIRPPSTDGVDRSQWLYMYFTMLHNNFVQDCRRSGKALIDCRELFEGHDIGMASSVDGGLTWTFRGKVVTATSAGDGKGAWMPAALVKDGATPEIWLYYSSGGNDFSTPNLFRQRLNANGLAALAPVERVAIDGFTAGQLYANVDVKAAAAPDGASTRYLMVANSGDQRRLHAFHSANGLQFQEVPESPILGTEAADGVILTPDIYAWGVETLAAPALLDTTAGGTSAFVFLNFVRKGPASEWELRRHEKIHVTIPN